MDKIYINLTTEGKYTSEYKQSVVYKTLRFMPKILKIKVDEYSKMFGITKQSLTNYFSAKTNYLKLTNAYTFASINMQLLQEKFKEQPEVDINKICDILYVNTDNYSKEQIEDAIAIFVLLPSYKNYKNILIEMLNKI